MFVLKRYDFEHEIDQKSIDDYVVWFERENIQNHIAFQFENNMSRRVNRHENFVKNFEANRYIDAFDKNNQFCVDIDVS